MIHFDYSTNWFIELVCVWVLSMVIRLKYILWSMYIDCNMYICDILSDPYSICQTNFDLGHTFYGFFLWKPISLSCRAFNLINETVHSVDHKVTKGRLEKKIIQNELVQREVRNYEVLRCDTEYNLKMYTEILNLWKLTNILRKRSRNGGNNLMHCSNFIFDRIVFATFKCWGCHITGFIHIRKPKFYTKSQYKPKKYHHHRHHHHALVCVRKVQWFNIY